MCAVSDSTACQSAKVWVRNHPTATVIITLLALTALTVSLVCSNSTLPTKLIVGCVVGVSVLLLPLFLRFHPMQQSRRESAPLPSQEGPSPIPEDDGHSVKRAQVDSKKLMDNFVSKFKLQSKVTEMVSSGDIAKDIQNAKSSVITYVSEGNTSLILLVRKKGEPTQPPQMIHITRMNFVWINNPSFEIYRFNKIPDDFFQPSLSKEVYFSFTFDKGYKQYLDSITTDGESNAVWLQRYNDQIMPRLNALFQSLHPSYELT